MAADSLVGVWNTASGPLPVQRLRSQRRHRATPSLPDRPSIELFLADDTKLEGCYLEREIVARRMMRECERL
jgi:hypothetical protein